MRYFWGDVARVELLKKLCVKKGSEICKAARVFTRKARATGKPESPLLALHLLRDVFIPRPWFNCLPFRSGIRGINRNRFFSQKNQSTRYQGCHMRKVDAKGLGPSAVFFKK